MSRKNNTEKNITVNVIDKEIIISKAFYKKASTYGTNEYKALKKAMKENKGFDIVFKKTEGKKTYNGLTFERMEEYIKTQPNSEENFKEYEKVKDVAKSKGALYPFTKNWFLTKFKDYKGEITENEISSNYTQNAKAA